jgi:hypothetical protein
MTLWPQKPATLPCGSVCADGAADAQDLPLPTGLHPRGWGAATQQEPSRHVESPFAVQNQQLLRHPVVSTGRSGHALRSSA